MNYLDITKKVVTTIVGIGTTTIVQSIIANNVDTTTITKKVTVGSASAVIGYAASEATSQYTDSKIDEIAVWWTKNVSNRPQN